MSGADAAQNGHAVPVAGGEAAHGDGHADPGQDHADQRGQIQKALRPLQGQPQFGPGVAHALQLLAGFQPGLRPGFEIFQRRRFAGQQQAILHPTAGLHQLGRGYIGQIHQ